MACRAPVPAKTLSMDFLGKLTLDADGTEITTEAEAARR